MKAKNYFVFYFFLVLGLAFHSFLSAQVAPSSSNVLLSSSYKVDSSWDTGYQGLVTLTNTTNADVTQWTATFSLPSNQSISSLWNANYTANGQNITVTNPTWTGGGNIQKGQSITFGLVIKKTEGANVLNNLQAWSGSAPDSSLPVPVIKTISLIKGTTNSYNVSWNKVSQATSYLLQQSTSSSFTNPTTIYEGNGNYKTCLNRPNGTYYYRVQSVNSNAKSAFSTTQSIVIGSIVSVPSPTLQPISYTAGSSQYSINWTSVLNAEGYSLQESTTSDFTDSQIIYTGANTSYQVSDKPSGTYFYRVVAIANGIRSNFSNIENIFISDPNSTAIVEGYWESWNSDPINSIINMKVDVIDVSFVTFSSTGNHTFQVTGLDATATLLAQFVTTAHQAGKKVKISVGGATYPLSGLLKTTDDALGMAQAISNFVQANQLDGVDFDIEDYPAPALQISLIKNTRQILEENKLISYTPKTPTATTFPYNQVIQEAHPYLTSVSMMAYDAYPGYDYQPDVQALIQMGVPASKIVVGLMPGMDDVGIATSLADIEKASQYVNNQELGGIMFWSLNRDLTNATGLGAGSATTTAWNIIH